MKNAAKHEKFAFGGFENIYISLPEPFRVRASSLLALAQGLLYISFIQRKCAKYTENGWHVDLKFYKNYL